ncbi:MAG: PEP-CTERM sorting domain-containing protein [Planctomycetota bacterium]
MNDTVLTLNRYLRRRHSRRVPNLGFLSIAVPLLFLAVQQPSMAGIVFWDPVDVERTRLTQIQMDTGALFGSFTSNPGLETDFEVSGFSSFPGARTRSGVYFAVQQVFQGSPLFVGTGVATDGSTLSSDHGRLLRLPAGTVIGSRTPFTIRGIAYDIPFPSGTFKWAPGDSGFVGLQLSINGQTHYGWAGLDLGSSIGSYTLTSFAYETDPNTPIIAGAEASIAGVGAVPEPSTLLVMGVSFGLLALRRRRMWLVRMTKAQLQHMKAKLGKRLPRFISPNSIGVEP